MVESMNMIADIKITEKSFGTKNLLENVSLTIDDGEKVGLIGRNGIGKSTLFGILSGHDKDYSGNIVFKRGAIVVATAQEYHNVGAQTVMEYVLGGLPEYRDLHRILTEYPEKMGDNLRMIQTYTDALTRFSDKNYHYIEDQVAEELINFQLADYGDRPFSSLSGGEKRLVEVVKIMNSSADLALIDEPTNFMDYIAKDQFIKWMKTAPEAILAITHDRDVLREVDRIVEIRDGETFSYKGNYDSYLKQNAVKTGSQMNDFEMIEKRIKNLKIKVLEYQRFKEKSRNPATIQKFKRLEMNSRAELAELQEKEKPTFWIDKENVAQMNYKTLDRYDKYKAKNVRIGINTKEKSGRKTILKATNLSLGYDKPLFSGVNLELDEGGKLEIRGRNGAGKTTLLKALLNNESHGFRNKSGMTANAPATSSCAKSQNPANHIDSATTRRMTTTSLARHEIQIFAGEMHRDDQIRIGEYVQEISKEYFSLSLEKAIEKVYLDKKLDISDTKIRQLLADYLFTDGDRATPLSRLSGGQKARFQIIAMLANSPQLLVLDEPTSHLDLPSIEELETALARYHGAILYISHDGYFRDNLGGEVLKI
jgi:ATPase subunit of ABC transporter with duplicated ATPase domains